MCRVFQRLFSSTSLKNHVLSMNKNIKAMSRIWVLANIYIKFNYHAPSPNLKVTIFCQRSKAPKMGKLYLISIKIFPSALVHRPSSVPSLKDDSVHCIQSSVALMAPPKRRQRHFFGDQKHQPKSENRTNDIVEQQEGNERCWSEDNRAACGSLCLQLYGVFRNKEFYFWNMLEACMTLETVTSDKFYVLLEV